MTPEDRQELHRLLSALCDGELPEADQARLAAMLAADPACRREYLQYVDVHARLLTHPNLAAPGPTLPPGVVPAATPPAGRRSRAGELWRYAAVAAATLAASLLVQFALWPPRSPETAERPPLPESDLRGPDYVATLTRCAGCVWEGGEALRHGSRLLPGDLRLSRGVARLRFDGGADLVVEGPAVLRLETDVAATVLRGKVVFRADETAVPFDLRTPASVLVDYGTEYAVAVTPEGEEVHVFEGEVRRTPRTGGSDDAEMLKAGQARRWSPALGPGQATRLAPDRFVRQPDAPPVAAGDPAGLLAYEGFDYADPDDLPAGRANGGVGWDAAWLHAFARPLNANDRSVRTLDPKGGLARPNAAVPAVGGAFDYTGFTKSFRRLATPVRLGEDGTYYLSYLFRHQGPPVADDPTNAVAVLFWTAEDAATQLGDPRRRLNVGVGSNQLFTHLEGSGSRTPLPLTYGETYLLVAKIVAGADNPDQVFLRVYAPLEPVEREEPGGWSVVGPTFRSDLTFEWLQLHVNSRRRQTIDEVRLGTTWASVAAPWIAELAAAK
jgi:anti-sigma factor RsiW